MLMPFKNQPDLQTVPFKDTQCQGSGCGESLHKFQDALIRPSMPVTWVGRQADIGIIRSPEQVIDASIIGIQVQTAIRYLLCLASDLRQVTLVDDMHTLPDAHFIERIGQCPSIVNSGNAQVASRSL